LLTFETVTRSTDPPSIRTASVGKKSGAFALGEGLGLGDGDGEGLGSGVFVEVGPGVGVTSRVCTRSSVSSGSMALRRAQRAACPPASTRSHSRLRLLPTMVTSSPAFSVPVSAKSSPGPERSVVSATTRPLIVWGFSPTGSTALTRTLAESFVAPDEAVTRTKNSNVPF